MPKERTELQREAIDALVESKAIDFEAVGNVLGRYGARAARNGDALGAIIHWRVADICIPPEPYVAQIVEIERVAGGQVRG
jgi:hypothetical protein